jgi:hypothetical protein
VTFDLPEDSGAILREFNCERPAALARIYDSWYTGERTTWHGQTLSLLSVVDPIVRALCKDFGFRLGRDTLREFLEPERLFLLACCSQDEMPDLYVTRELVRLRAKFAILPRIRQARDASEVFGDGDRFLHPMHYVSMPAQAWLRDDACVVPEENVELSGFLAAFDAC